MQWNAMIAVGLAAAVAASAAMAQAPDKASQTFIENAIEGNYSEINIGQLAQQKGTTDAVRNFGKMLVDDHTANNEKAKDLAKQLNVTPPSGSSFGEKGTYLKLKVLSGKSFDQSFAKSMVEDHEADIKDFQKEADKSGPAAAFAKQTLPVLQKHLHAAQQLEQQTQTTGSR